MANEKFLSKIKLGNQVYEIKDSTVRDIISTYGSVVTHDVITDYEAAGNNDIVTKENLDTRVGFLNDAIGSIDSKVQALSQAVSQIHSFEYVIANQLPTPAASELYKIYLIPAQGSEGNVYDEYLCVNVEAEYKFEKIGSTAASFNEYVKKTTTIAGVDLQDNITKAELQSALDLGALAYKDSAAGSTKYTPAGSVSATVGTQAADATLTKADYTPAGNVTGTVIPSGAVTLGNDAEGYQITGTNNASAVTITPTTSSVLGGVRTAAVAPTFTEGAFTPASLSYTSPTFATEGVVAAMDTTDDEMLVLTAATTGTGANISAFDGGSKASDTFTAGSAAVFDTADVWTGYTAAEAAAQTFTGGKIGATFTGNQSGDAINATFAGTKATNALVTGVSYDKTTVSDLAFSGTEATISITAQ